MQALIPFLLRFLVASLDKSVVDHSAKADAHQRAANSHQGTAEQSSKILTALLSVLNG